jgi:hypothetical protein
MCVCVCVCVCVCLCTVYNIKTYGIHIILLYVFTLYTGLMMALNMCRNMQSGKWKKTAFLFVKNLFISATITKEIVSYN